MQYLYTITTKDIGSNHEALGRVQAIDIGKRVYRTQKDTIVVESAEQSDMSKPENIEREIKRLERQKYQYLQEAQILQKLALTLDGVLGKQYQLLEQVTILKNQQKLI
jgi:hypothetical protein